MRPFSPWWIPFLDWQSTRGPRPTPDSDSQSKDCRTWEAQGYKDRQAQKASNNRPPWVRQCNFKIGSRGLSSLTCAIAMQGRRRSAQCEMAAMLSSGRPFEAKSWQRSEVLLQEWPKEWIVDEVQFASGRSELEWFAHRRQLRRIWRFVLGPILAFLATSLSANWRLPDILDLLSSRWSSW